MHAVRIWRPSLKVFKKGEAKLREKGVRAEGLGNWGDTPDLYGVDTSVKVEE